MTAKKLAGVFIYAVRNILFFTGLTVVFVNHLYSQKIDYWKYVDPFIGTAKSDAITKWGSEGGTYPGAVAPAGFIQLSPETRMANKGYDYNDSVIYFFSCLNHNSGFPNGSSGNLFIMPVDDTTRSFQAEKYNRKFSHQNERAQPGYYSVLFKDNNTLAEAASSVHTGIFRFTFPAHIVPRIFVGDAGEFKMPSKHVIHSFRHHAAIHFSEDCSDRQQVKDGNIFSFSPSSLPVVILIKIGVSTVSIESAQKNIDVEIGDAGFDEIKEKTRMDWIRELSVVETDVSNEKKTTIFYTALYHSLLVPWIISDVDGNYKGYDGLIHRAKGKNEYGKFSPWDTFRSLHPLLCLLYPGKQKDMVLSMLDIFQQSGWLPTESMTGNHVIPIIVDSYLKGIKGFDTEIAYAAMKKSILTGPFIQSDMGIYKKQGFIPFSYPESVSRTVEYAYDDWALSQFAKLVMRNKGDYDYLVKESYNYRSLFNPEELFLLPRSGNEFKFQAGNSGYKEGDKWVYTYFVPQNQRDLINLAGGDSLFAGRLDSALANQQIIFDNETVFHIPYLFNEANYPGMTQKWVRRIMDSRFKASPGGLPGNDDLGSISSWYVLSAMGIYPVCPGRPEYAIGSPIFNSLTIHLANGKKWIIKSTHSSFQNIFIKSLSVNHQPYHRLWLSHSRVTKGGEMIFDMCSSPANKWQTDNSGYMFSETRAEPRFQLLNYSVQKIKLEPDENSWVYFSIRNRGATGTKVVKLFINGLEYGRKNCLIEKGAVITDSISYQMYAFGKAKLRIEGLKETEIEIIQHKHLQSDEPKISNFIVKPIIRLGEMQQIFFDIKNTGGHRRTFYFPVTLQDSLICTDTATLNPGEIRNISKRFKVIKQGFQTVTVNKIERRFKAYQSDKEASILDLSVEQSLDNDHVQDRSGFGNNGKIIRSDGNIQSRVHDSLLVGNDCFIEIPNSRSLDVLGETITIMLWVYPTGDNKELADIFTKGDNHVLQVAENKTLTFFAGGWGRGDCTADLPDKWINNWHHLAGVCDGISLKLYIDGDLKAVSKLETKANLSNTNKWVIGRNEEFPLQRIFNGYVNKIKIFTEPLSKEDIKSIMNQ